MSSKFVRERMLEELSKVDSTIKAVDITMEFEELEDFLEENDIDMDEGWLGIQFLSSIETPIDIVSTNTQGTFREEGDVLVHVTYPTHGGYEKILLLAEKVRNYFRAKRFNSIVIEDVSPPQFGMGVALNFEGGFSSAVVTIGYHRDLVL